MQQHCHSVEEQIVRLRALPAMPAPWNPRRPAQRVLDRARSLAESNWHNKIPIPSLIATEDGGVHIKWVRGPRHLSAFISPDDTFEFLAVENGQPFAEDGKLQDLLSWLIEE